MRQSQEIGSLDAASSAALADLYFIRINIVCADYPCFGRAESLLYIVSLCTAKVLKCIDITKEIKLKMY